MKKVTVGKPLIRLRSVDSTNVYATRLLRENKADEGTVILADHQTMGKGQGGNLWISEAGSNLLLSLILMPDFLPAERQFYLSMCTSGAIVDFLLPYSNDVAIKWPNDILLDRKKIAGILIENTILHKNLHSSVVGIGLNINQNNFPPGVHNPTSLSLVTGRKFNLTESFKILLTSLSLHVDKLYDQRFGEIKTSYLNNLLGMNKWAMYSDSAGTFEGRIVDVTDTGELVVVKRTGPPRNYGFREIESSPID